MEGKSFKSFLTKEGQDLTGMNSTFGVVLGTQWGDEGKGKLVDILAAEYDVCARFNGGSNAGHTVKANGHKYAFHLLPCGLLYPSCVNVIGNGVVVHLQSLFKELKQLDDTNVEWKDRLLVSNRAHLTLNFHREVDGLIEAKKGSKKIGTTKQGIGPSYATKALRINLRVGDLVNWDTFLEKYNTFVEQATDLFDYKDYDKEKELEEIKPLRDLLMEKNMIVDTVSYLHKALTGGKKILAEGANATMLDLDHGTYPMVTSSSTVSGGIMTGLGLPPQVVETIVGVVKAYTTRVGEGPFPTELVDAIGEKMQDVGQEWGVTSGRKRRCGWLDLNVVKYAHRISGLTSINLTKLDVLTGFEELKIATHYKLNDEILDGEMPVTLPELEASEPQYVTLPGWTEDLTGITKYSDLPENAKKYCEKIEEIMDVPISWVGVGPDRDQCLIKE